MEMALVTPMDGEEAVLELNALGLAGALELIGGADQQGTPAELVVIVVEQVGEQRAEESFVRRQRPDVFSSSIRAADPLSWNRGIRRWLGKGGIHRQDSLRSDACRSMSTRERAWLLHRDKSQVVCAFAQHGMWIGAGSNLRNRR